MRNKTQERIEELARERAASAIDLALVEEGIEIGKRMMAEMIATYTPAPSRAARAPAVPARRGHPTASAAAPSPCQDPRLRHGGYLNEVRR